MDVPPEKRCRLNEHMLAEIADKPSTSADENKKNPSKSNNDNKPEEPINAELMAPPLSPNNQKAENKNDDIPPYMDIETYTALMADPKENLLIWDRLRHGLNPDCLAVIFDYLSMYELSKMSEISDYFQNIIYNNIIRTRTIDLAKQRMRWKFDQFFQIFGKRMRKLTIGRPYAYIRIDLFLKLIINHCEKDMLNELAIYIYNTISNNTLLKKSMEFFKNIQSLTIPIDFLMYDEQFLNEFAKNAIDLKKLTILKGSDAVPHWSKLNEMHNLEELRIHRCNIPDTLQFTKMLETKYNLKTFSFGGTREQISEILKIFAKNCPMLEYFGDNGHKKVCHCHRHDELCSEIKQRYAGIEDLQHLRGIEITLRTFCGTDLYYTLTRLPDTLETLKLSMNDIATAIKLPDAECRRHMERYIRLTRFTKLKNIHIYFRKSFGDPIYLQCVYVFHVLSKLPNFNSLTLAASNLCDVYKLLDLFPKIKYFDISLVYIRYLPVEMLRIVRAIRLIKQKVENGGDIFKKIHLIVNKQQWNEIQVYKDIDELVTSNIKHDQYLEHFESKIF